MASRQKLNGLERRLARLIHDMDALCVAEHQRYARLPEHEKQSTGIGAVCQSTTDYLRSASRSADQARETIRTILNWPEMS